MNIYILTCRKLECLSLGNNRIAGLDQIIKLRQVKSLKMLALAGNPVVQDAECQPITLAYLENLQYLDYALIEPLDRHNAREQYHDELLDVEESESVVNEQVSLEEFKNPFLYTLVILCHVEWCIRKPLSPSIISYNINITHNHHTDIPLF